MTPERDRWFSKRGATLGLVAVTVWTLAILAAAVVVAFLLRLAF